MGFFRAGLAALSLTFVFALAVAPLLSGTARGGEADKPPRLRLACTTFPVWLLTRNVTVGITLFEIDLVLPADSGCPHDYEPAPQDIRRIAVADALVINGLGLDNALVPPPPVLARDPVTPVIDASLRDRPSWIRSGARASDDDVHNVLPPDVAAEWETGPGDEDDDHGHHDTHDGHGEWNPHYFASPEEAALAAVAIARGIDKHFGQYLTAAQRRMMMENVKRYTEDLRALAGTMRGEIAKLPSRRIVTHHDAFDYFARDLGLRVVGLLETHPGVEPSPAELKRMVETARLLRAGGVFTEPQFDPALALLAAEGIGVAHGVLDAVASGSIEAPLDHYQKTMRANLAQLVTVLGKAEP